MPNSPAPNPTSHVRPRVTGPPSTDTSNPAIVGGTIGGAVVLITIVILIICCYRKKWTSFKSNTKHLDQKSIRSPNQTVHYSGNQGDQCHSSRQSGAGHPKLQVALSVRTEGGACAISHSPGAYCTLDENEDGDGDYNTLDDLQYGCTMPSHGKNNRYSYHAKHTQAVDDQYDELPTSVNNRQPATMVGDQYDELPTIVQPVNTSADEYDHIPCFGKVIVQPTIIQNEEYDHIPRIGNVTVHATIIPEDPYDDIPSSQAEIVLQTLDNRPQARFIVMDTNEDHNTPENTDHINDVTSCMDIEEHPGTKSHSDDDSTDHTDDEVGPLNKQEHSCMISNSNMDHSIYEHAGTYSNELQKDTNINGQHREVAGASSISPRTVIIADNVIYEKTPGPTDISTLANTRFSSDDEITPLGKQEESFVVPNSDMDHGICENTGAYANDLRKGNSIHSQHAEVADTSSNSDPMVIAAENNIYVRTPEATMISMPHLEGTGFTPLTKEADAGVRSKLPTIIVTDNDIYVRTPEPPSTTFDAQTDRITFTSHIVQNPSGHHDLADTASIDDDDSTDHTDDEMSQLDHQEHSATISNSNMDHTIYEIAATCTNLPQKDTGVYGQYGDIASASCSSRPKVIVADNEIYERTPGTQIASTLADPWSISDDDESTDRTDDEAAPLDKQQHSVIISNSDMDHQTDKNTPVYTNVQIKGKIIHRQYGEVAGTSSSSQLSGIVVDNDLHKETPEPGGTIWSAHIPTSAGEITGRRIIVTENDLYERLSNAGPSDRIEESESEPDEP